MQHLKTTWTLACWFVAVGTVACGSDGHPPGVADPGSTGGTDGGGSGGKRAGGAGGSHERTDGGTVDGGGADAGPARDASSGGSSGMGSGGADNSGGSGGASDGGPLRDANSGAGGDVAPVTPGSIGTGNVECDGVAGNLCGAGSACCAKAYQIARECVTGFADCSCYAEGSCPLLGCDGPEDCPDAKCCATVTMDGAVGTTWCKKDCEKVEQEVCKDAGDCTSTDAVCTLFGAGIMTCN